MPAPELAGPDWEQLRTSARRQGGAFSLAQARAVGITGAQLHALARRGVLLQFRRTVWVAASTPMTSVLAEHAALLRLGTPSVLSHLSAAAFYDAGVRPAVPMLSVPPTRRVPDDGSVTVFRTRRLEVVEVTDGRRVTPAARTVVDLGRLLPERELAAALLSLLQRGRCTTEAVLAALDAVGPTYAGAARVRRVAQQFDVSYESILGVEAWRLLHNHVPDLVRGHRVRTRSGQTRICDLAVPRLRLDIEADSWGWHGTRDRQNADKHRDAELAAEGWLTLRLPSEDIRSAPATTLRRVLAVVQRREAELAA
jgi:very-short-patch-repair endonuclease